MTATNDKKQLSYEIVAILQKLGEPQTDFQNQARSAFLDQRFSEVKRIRTQDLTDSYLRAFSYLASAVAVSDPKNPAHGNYPTVLSEAIMATADYQKEKCLKELSGLLDNPDQPIMPDHFFN